MNSFSRETTAQFLNTTATNTAATNVTPQKIKQEKNIFFFAVFWIPEAYKIIGLQDHHAVCLSVPVFPPVSNSELGDQCSQNLAWILHHQSPTPVPYFLSPTVSNNVMPDMQTSEATSNINVNWY